MKLRSLWCFAKTFALLFANFLAAGSTAFAVAVPDASFGSNGKVVLSSSSGDNYAALLVQPDDKIVAVGKTVNSATGEDAVVIRLNQNGAFDADFGIGGKTIAAVSPGSDVFTAVALQPDNKIVAAGSFYSTQTQSTDFLLVRFDANGALDASFGNNGVVSLNQGSTDRFTAVKVQPDGKIVAVGKTSDQGRAAAIRFNPNGSLDTGFAGGYIFFDVPGLSEEEFRSLDFYPDGRIIIGGVARIIGNGYNDPSVFLVALEPGGALIPDFGDQGIVKLLVGNDLYFRNVKVVILPNNNILAIGGTASRLLSSRGVGLRSDLFIGPETKDVAVLSNGNLAVAQSPTVYVSPAGIKLYNRNFQVVNSATNSASQGYAIAAQSNNKLLVLQQSLQDYSINLTRYNAPSSNGTRIADFDGDARSDFAVVRPSSNAFFLLRSDGANTNFQAQTLLGKIIPEPLNHRSDGRLISSIFWWRAAADADSAGYFQRPGAVSSVDGFQWGTTGDVPVGGDYDGDGRTDYAVFRPSDGIWYILQTSNNQPRYVRWGQAGDKLVPADYDYDGVTDVAVYRPSNGVWYVLKSSDGQLKAAQFGLSEDIPVTGDYDGDGSADFAVFRPSNGVWYVLNSSAGFRAAQFGIASDEPVPGDYDGDGQHDIAVFRSGVWHIFGSTRGYFGVQWGTAGDVPVAVRY